ncbi:MAG: nucleotidyl transferase AbiEii/AbiGii toxin family protein [Bacteroidetes bacterium]|nr:nucleotidyl transferase AbiEii/AbiGii toxin family protein [Bacteroidota bacterium]MBU1579152.1 nucleotidyl transferase AbiEii/AbiGii toxin family protein [Bacteroidota bacterium]MBU2556799.1 nucleotidyl transferase AbiEii/AbiGii toxin family protein [Bacteroidota bacterium]
MIKWLKIPDNTKKNAYEQLSELTGMTPFAVEKDWWVSRTLEIIFQMDIAKHLVFKGGTSLSKAWKLISRFSEDVDLAIDKDFFEGFTGNLSKSKITRLRKMSGAYTTGNFFRELQEEFRKKGFTDVQFIPVAAQDSDQDPRIIEIHYPSIITSASEYLQPRVQLEIGCRSLREPFTLKSFGSLVDEFYKDSDFVEPLFQVPTVNPERTFLEKLFLLHEEFQRPPKKMRVNRLSRHLYDVYHLSGAGIAEIALNDKQLYETIAAHRYKFSKVGGVDYNTLNPKTLNPIPVPEVIDAWESDYSKMMQVMIYEPDKPSFTQLINNLHQIKTQLQSLQWEFQLKF